jgi:hypothetical protein
MDSMFMAKGTFSVTSSWVLKRILRKGMAITNEKSAKKADKMLNTMFRAAKYQYGLI